MKDCTTLCYLERDGAYLMLHRTKKKNDQNHDKYIGIGGHVEKGETPEMCIRREIEEETGLIVGELKLRGLLTFVFEEMDQLAWLYTSDDFSGEEKECDEGDLQWVPKSKIEELPIWEGDKLFFSLLNETEKYFSLQLVYEGGKLISWERTI